MVTDNYEFITLQHAFKNDKRMFTVTGKLNSAFLRRDTFLKSNIHAQLLHATSFLPSAANTSERVFCVQNNITQQRKCVCGVYLKFISSNQGYLKSCFKCIRKVGTSWKSSGATTTTNILKEKQDFINYINNNDSLQASSSDVMHFIQSKSNNPSECMSWVSREDYRDNKHILKAIISTTNNISWSIKQFNWSNRMYNIMHNTHDGKLCDVCGTTKTRYINYLRGYTSCCSKKECVQTLGCKNRITNHINTITPVIDQQGFDVMIDEHYRGLNHDHVDLKCRTCDSLLNYNICNGGWKNIRCHVCFGDTGISHEEKTVAAFIKQHASDVLENHKAFVGSHKELDVYIPSKNLAVEYNGVLWHSFGTSYPNNISDMIKNKNNHFKKHKMCSEHNIKLLQITSLEWNNKHKQDIWKSIISSHLGTSQKIHARKCSIVELDGATTNAFLNLNHLQGMSNAKVKLGLQYNNQLVSVMTFSKPRFNKKYEWELVRFCNLLNHTVVGGASRLLRYFINKYTPKNLISYADARYSKGDMYTSLGFKFVKYTPPAYIYIKGDKIVSRFTAQKHRLSKLIKSFDINKTELQNMLDAGYRRMWDAGTMLFEYKKISTTT